MTQARTAAYGVVTPPPLQRWLNAVLLLCVSLVHRVRATFGMWRRSSRGDWHTALETETLPQTKPDIQFQEANSTPGAVLGHAPGNSDGASQGFTGAPRETDNRAARQAADLLVRVACGGGHPVLRAAQTHNHGSALPDLPQARLRESCA